VSEAGSAEPAPGNGHCPCVGNKAFRKLDVIPRIGSKAVRDGWKEIARKWKDFSEPLGLIFSVGSAVIERRVHDLGQRRVAFIAPIYVPP
jgi:hypothetical protein